MEPEPEKISFGFSKLSKKPTLLPKKQPDAGKKLELIDCLEGQSIKIKDAIEEIKEPLIIPLKENKKNLIDRIKETRAKAEAKTEEPKDERPDSELTTDELAERELLREARNRLENAHKPDQQKVFVLPIKEDKLELEGEKEPTLEDYEKIPITDFGMAMLRGMGWQEEQGIGKKPSKVNLAAAPDMRPKGLGLGANKMVKKEMPQEAAVDNNGAVLVLKKGTFVKIIAGSHKGQYGEVLGLDDEAARVIVKTALKSNILTLNEFLVVPVTKEEYAKFSKVLNHAKFEEYKEKDKRHENDELKTEHKEDERDRSRSSRRSYHSSDSSLEYEKHNKVHKRKDKKRHRDKSRSPKRHNRSKSSRKSYNKQSTSSSDSDYGERKRRTRKNKR